MGIKLLRTCCIFVTPGSFYFCLTRFGPNVDMKTKAFKKLDLVQKRKIIYSFLYFIILYVTSPFLILHPTSIHHISVNINVSNDAQ